MDGAASPEQDVGIMTLLVGGPPANTSCPKLTGKQSVNG